LRARWKQLFHGETWKFRYVEFVRVILLKDIDLGIKKAIKG
jgi:hypothetical protein